ncbi:N-acetylmuramoyl-L-alanine amidase [Bacillus thuringiensis]
MEKYIVDISKWNKNINWDIAAPQLDLAICRVQYGSNTIDALYKNHVANLEIRNIPHGAYAYGCYVSVNDAVIEARDFLKRVDSNAKFLVLDVEDDTLKSCGANRIAEASQAFIDTCKKAGWKTGLYVAHHMYSLYGLQNVKADFLWLPRYGTNNGLSQIKPNYSCDIWQYTDNGYIDGIGKVDLNKLIGNKNLSWFISENEKQYYITTGGLSIEGIMEISQFLIEGNYHGQIQFIKDGTPFLKTDALNEVDLNNFKKWLDERKWWYEVGN